MIAELQFGVLPKKIDWNLFGIQYNLTAILNFSSRIKKSIFHILRDDSQYSF